MSKINFNSDQFSSFVLLVLNNKDRIISLYLNNSLDLIERFKKGSKIKIKKKNQGKFTSWCGGQVTDECIKKGKNDPNPLIRKRATFADNARHFNH